MKIIRATKLADRAGAYYVRIQAMARKHHITQDEEFDEHDGEETHYIVAIDDVLPVATCRFYEKAEGQVVLGRIVVLPEYRRQGLGTRVVQEAERWAKELGYHTVVLEARVNKVKFYEQMGYVGDYSHQVKESTFECYEMKKAL